MNGATILRHEAVDAIDSGETFDLVFVTADRRRGTGGSIKRVSAYVKIKGDEPINRLPGQFRNVSNGRSRNPNHGEHKTFNIYNPHNRGEHAIKVHWRLMIFFNGKRILQ